MVLVLRFVPRVVELVSRTGDAALTTISALTAAGFRLDARSEVNANPKDTKDYPLGVWTLPPTSARTKPPYMLEWSGRPSESLLKDPAFYKAIGESDRMTLRFRKPG